MLWIAARDPRTPLAAKLVGGLIAAYALSPIDFIPDFVPILGLLDELILVPIGLAIAVMLVPKPLMAEFRDAADVAVQRPVSRLGAAIIIALWAIIGTFIALQIWALRYW
ncbi:DUF1232 domain-containing protein [Sandaracinobacter sp. RS1-74]|uniref:YkvA family protein n=1 Tax=Sandaracinobacteroides sayramensis TaxID=2913411 RepID=UPI001EDAD0F4|nr:DUF1232 domain-containing protein [Sandaracinobacteroides sayramensis]MCG2839963.1 DUF1232 domain-containing protein [Sandaracinobacteroides sayramensis]